MKTKFPNFGEAVDKWDFTGYADVMRGSSNDSLDLLGQELLKAMTQHGTWAIQASAVMKAANGFFSADVLSKIKASSTDTSTLSKEVADATLTMATVLLCSGIICLTPTDLKEQLDFVTGSMKIARSALPQKVQDKISKKLSVVEKGAAAIAPSVGAAATAPVAAASASSSNASGEPSAKKLRRR